MRKDELMKMIGKEITVEFKDGTSATGILGYTPEFSSVYGFRAPNYFFINNYDFKVSHLRKIVSKG